MTTSKQPRVLAVKACIVSLFLACSLSPALSAESGHNHADHDGHHHAAPHGGTVLIVGHHVAYLEIVINHAQGILTLYSYDDHGKELMLEKAPYLNLIVNKKRMQIKLKAKSAQLPSAIFIAQDWVLRQKLEGRISLKIGNKTHQVKLALGHKGHDHGGHKGHDHGSHEGHDHSAHDK